jgi:hypothetical protein
MIVEARRGGEELMAQELEAFSNALNILEEQLGGNARVDLYDYDSTYVDIHVCYSDGSYENKALLRSRLIDGSSPREIANWID